MKPKTILLLLLVALAMGACNQPKDKKNYLKTVLNNLEKIESVTYYSSSEAWNPGDTAAYSIEHMFIIEINNPGDSTIGVNFIKFLQEDTTLMQFSYDGNMKAFVNHDTKIVSIDSFKVERFPFRLIAAPFFNYTKNILKYALETTDSISLEIDEENESVYVCLTIFEDQQIEFFGKAYRMPVPPPEFYNEPTSKYELWIDKKTNLPYKYRREMSHSKSIETISNLRFPKAEEFNASNFFPAGYVLQIAGKGSGAINFSNANLINKMAPDWSLYSTEDVILSLSNLKSKPTIIMFTSVSCGPCKVATPFLNELAAESENFDFNFVAIECSTQGMNALKMYRDKNNISYTLLQSTDDVKKNYGILGFPLFFILDKNHIVQKVVQGYSKGSTDDEIRKAIDELL